MISGVNIILYILYGLSIFFAILLLKTIVLGSKLFNKKWYGVLLYLFGFIAFTILFILSFILLNTNQV